mgnify:CR=1 FL=1
MRTISSDFLETFAARPVPAAEGPWVAMRDRIALLGVGDQLFLQMILDEGKTLREVARLVGCDPGNVSRRLRALLKRLRDPLVLALCDKRCPIPADYREIGLDYFLRGQTSREIAHARNLSRFAVMQVVHFMRSWFRGLCANRAFLPR